MTELPEGFDSWEHLQSTYMLEYNKRVDRFFSDVSGSGDLSSTRASLKLACRLVDGDNIATWNLRTSLFFDVLGYSRKYLAVVYGSKFATAPPVAGHPQLFLVFSQDSAATPSDEPPIVHEKSVRLMRFSCASGDDDNSTKPPITKADMIEIGREIKNLFIENSKGITYTTGNKSASYTDPENGFAKGNYLLVNNRTDAVEVYQKLCNAIDVPFKQEKLRVNDPDKPSTTSATAGSTTILGKSVKNRKFRPVANLRFRSAYISLGNLIEPVTLIDTTLSRPGLIKFP